MKSQIVYVLLALILTKTTISDAFSENQQTPTVNDHFLVYTMVLTGGLVTLTICLYNEKRWLDMLYRSYPGEPEINIMTVRSAMVIFPLCGGIVGAATGYILECIFRRQE